MCERILEKGCEIDLEDILGRSSLYYAVKNGHFDIVKVYLVYQYMNSYY